MTLLQRFQMMDVGKYMQDVFSEDEEMELYDMSNDAKLYETILKAPSPSDLLLLYIESQYDGVGDWGYSHQLEPLFVGSANLSKDEREKLLNILYIAPTYIKHSHDDGLDSLLKKYFPPDQILFVRKYLMNKKIDEMGTI